VGWSIADLSQRDYSFTEAEHLYVGEDSVGADDHRPVYRSRVELAC
jgi:hypothetical protein